MVLRKFLVQKCYCLSEFCCFRENNVKKNLDIVSEQVTLWHFISRVLRTLIFQQSYFLQRSALNILMMPYQMLTQINFRIKTVIS